jgi:phospholipase A1
MEQLEEIGKEIGGIIDYNRENNSKSGLSTNKPNYLLPVTYSSYRENRKKSEVKFQFSVKQRFLRFFGWAWFLGYTQTSFWQAYDLEDSRPFRENNFNPETFIRTKMWNGVRFDAGIEHESNGEREALSRSWNRSYFTAYYENRYLISSLKLWHRFSERRKRYPGDTEGDDNPDIQKFLGYGQFSFTLKAGDFHIASLFRFNPIYRRGCYSIELSFPMYTSSMYYFVQYWDGYGESLIDYNISQRKIGFGFMFTR